MYQFRTFRVNTIFSLIADMASVSDVNKNGQSVKIDRKLRLIAAKGVISNKICQDLGELINF